MFRAGTQRTQFHLCTMVVREKPFSDNEILAAMSFLKDGKAAGEKNGVLPLCPSRVEGCLDCSHTEER